MTCLACIKRLSAGLRSEGARLGAWRGARSATAQLHAPVVLIGDAADGEAVAADLRQAATWARRRVSV